MFTTNVIIAIINWVYSIVAFSQSVSYLAKSKVIVRYGFWLGWFINIYWVAFGLWFNWYGNIAITVYFIFLNYYGNRQWGNKPIKSTKLPKISLAIGITLTFVTAYLTGTLLIMCLAQLTCLIVHCMQLHIPLWLWGQSTKSLANS